MVTDTAFFRNKNYHTENDLPETLDYQRMSKVIQGVFKAVWAIDGGCQRFPKAPPPEGKQAAKKIGSKENG